MTALAVLLAGCSAESRKAKALERAGTYFKSGEFDKAEIECQNILKLDPENPRAIEHLGLIWLERGAPMRALPFLTKIRRESPGNRDVQHRVLQITLSLGKLAEARREATLILQRFPEDKEAIVVLARAARSREDLEAVEQALKKADRGTAAYHLASAHLLLRRGDANGARAALQRAVGLEPQSAQVRSAQAAYYLRLNNPNLAGPEFKAAAELAPLRSEERIRYAEFLMQTGASAEATSKLKEITEKAPDYFPAWRGLAYLAMAEKKYDDALALLDRIFNRDPANYEARIARAQVWLAKGEFQQGIDELERLGKQFPGAAEDKFVLGQAYLQNGDPAQAMVALRKAVTQNPDHPQAVLLLARLNLAAGDAESAAKAMTDLLTDQPNNMPAQMLLVEAMGALGRFEEIAETLRAQIEISPERVELHRLLGLVLIQLQKPVEARQSLERSLELTPDFVPIVAELVSLDLREKNFAAAMQRAQKQIAKMPASAAARVLEARVHGAEGRWDDAETVLLKALELEPDFAGTYDLLGRSFVARKDSPQIIARVDEFLAKRSGNLNAVLLAGNVYAQLQAHERARDAYEKYLSIKPDATTVLNNLAFIYAEHLNKPDRGLELARQARKLDSRSPEIADTLGWILYQRGDHAEALELFKESAAKLPKNGEVQYHLGLASQKMGQTEMARAAYQRASQASGEFPGKREIPQRLAELPAQVVGDTGVPPEAQKSK
jgi:tetratricopeptide (TPR) repeat protein